MIRNQIKNGLVHGVVFFLTVGFLSFTYAAITNIWTNTSELEVTTESTLTADNWNKLLGNFEFLKSRTEGISSNGGNVGIGVENPTNKLEINGNLKMQGIGNSIVYSKGNNNSDLRVITRISPDNDKIDDFEIITFNRTNGVENHRTRYSFDGTWYFPSYINIGYEIITDSRIPGPGATTYNVYCPSGKFLLSSSVRTHGGRMNVAHDNLNNGVLVLSDRNQFNSQLSSGVFTTLICANIK